MGKLNMIAFICASIPKTITFNLKTFGFQGLKLPVFVSYKTVVYTHKGAVRINGRVAPFMMTFGYGGSPGIVSNSQSALYLEKGSLLVITGKTHFAEGCAIRNDGIITLGERFSMNKNSMLSCYKQVSIGSDFTGGWNVNIRDSDGHYMIKNGEKQQLYSPVNIGNKVWVCSFSDILKGVSIGNNCVVAYKSMVLKPFKEEKILIGGHPAKMIQDNIDWCL